MRKMLKLLWQEGNIQIKYAPFKKKKIRYIFKLRKYSNQSRKEWISKLRKYSENKALFEPHLKLLKYSLNIYQYVRITKSSSMQAFRE